jgi:DNA-binding MarR family transcriptional regulator
VKNDSVILELQRATHATLQLLATELVDLDLTASEINALGNLSDRKGRTVSELGADVGSRPATLTGILDRLERRGLIARSTRAGDRRSVVIELTAEGEQVAALVRKTMRAIERRALAGLPDGSVDAARAVVRALTEVGR